MVNVVDLGAKCDREFSITIIIELLQQLLLND